MNRLDPDDDYAYHPLNRPPVRDYRLAVCHWCHELIAPKAEREFNGWDYHADCLPLSVIEGQEAEARADEARDGR